MICMINIYEDNVVIDGKDEIKNWRIGYLPDIRIFI